jgi:integrase
VLYPAAKRAGLPEDLVPYDLRHTFASLLIWEGKLSIVEIAAQMGHSPRMLLSTYAHVIAELSGQQMEIEVAIRRARERATAHKRPTTGTAG